MKKRFLFLQGPATPFFRRLAERLRALGHDVHKMQFNAGDVVYWEPRRSTWVSGRADLLAASLHRLRIQKQLTDIVLFGDCRPVHRDVLAQPALAGLTIHVFEEGYFRPHWITLERDGVNARSRLPRDPDWYRKHAEGLGEPQAQPFRSSFRARALHDVAYHVASALNPLVFPRYRTHQPEAAPLQYAAYLARFARLPVARRRDAALLAQLCSAARKGPLFLLPLQLDGDAQIREHSPYPGMREVITEVLESFARHAPGDAELLIKNHPLDPGLVDFATHAAEVALGLDLGERVHFVETGELGQILPQLAGCVTVNSTVGMVALAAGVPTLCLAPAIYRMPGLATGMSLASFWHAPQPPDAALFDAFRRVVVHTTQINGGYYTRDGMALAVSNAVPRLLAEHAPLEAWLA